MLSLDQLKLTLGPNNFNFTLRAKPDSVSAIVGKSGSGKSTLLNLIAGFVKPSFGTLSWQGTNLLPMPPEARPVTTLFQQHNLFSHLTVRQNIGLGIHPSLKLDSQQQAQIETALAEVGMADHIDKHPSALSGGEQQRIALARCLLRKQPVLLLDEPFSALDADTRNTMLEITQSVIQQHKLCTLLVTHNHDDAAFFDATVFEINNGELAET